MSQSELNAPHDGFPSRATIRTDLGYLPLETRGAILTPEQLENVEALPDILTGLAGRGYNTLVLPLLKDGSLTVSYKGSGALSQRRRCPLREALFVAADYPFSVMLSIDLLTAGPAGSDRLGKLAASNRQWLMKNAQGKTRIHDLPDVPALFCWTTIDYRRMLGNLMVEIAESQRFDGLIFDLRRIPKSTEKPHTWTHLGYSSLQRIQRELGVDLESFLNQPTIETLRAIELWRLEQLHRFIENIKARVFEVRQPLLTSFFGTSRRSGSPFVPWIDALNQGLLEELILDADPSAVLGEMEYVDLLVSEPRPWAALLPTEDDLSRARIGLEEKSACGFYVESPDAFAEEPLEEAKSTWDVAGAMEVSPIAAVRAVIADILPMVQGSDRLREFFEKLDIPLATFGESIRPEEARLYRQDIQKIGRKLKGYTAEANFPKDEVQRKISLIARLLQLAPFHSVEF